MKVTVRQFGEGGIEQVFQLEDPFDVIIEIGEQSFRISHPSTTSLFRVAVSGRLVIHPETADSICLTEAK